MSIEKRMTAYVIPNAIQVITLHARYTFASFLSRDTTYDLICNIWKMVHPGVPTSAALPDSTSKTDLTTSNGQEADEADGNAVDENGEPAASGKGVKKRLLGGRRKRGDTATSDSSANGSGQGNKENVNPASGAATTTAVNGTTSMTKHHQVKMHRETQDTCPTLANLKEVCMDTVFPSTPEKIYNLMFTSGFMKEFWQDDQKLTGPFPHSVLHV